MDMWKKTAQTARMSTSVKKDFESIAPRPSVAWIVSLKKVFEWLSAFTPEPAA
jgi:hypothetical protein